MIKKIHKEYGISLWTFALGDFVAKLSHISVIFYFFVKFFKKIEFFMKFDVFCEI